MSNEFDPTWIKTSDRLLHIFFFLFFFLNPSADHDFYVVINLSFQKYILRVPLRPSRLRGLAIRTTDLFLK